MKKQANTEMIQEGGVVFPLKPYSVTQLANMYGVCKKTIWRWLAPFKEEIGEKSGHFYTIPQVRIILSKLGIPGDQYAE